MTTDIVLPPLTPTMEDATLVSWAVSEGDQVAAGDVIATIEADKAAMDLEAVEDGVILKILVPDGTEGVKVDSVIAVMGEEGESIAVVPGEEPGESKPEREEAAPDKPSPVDADTKSAASDTEGERIFASPLARRIADEAGINLENVPGTGVNGRILKVDVLEYIEETGKGGEDGVEGVAKTKSPGISTEIPLEEAPLSNMRKVIARRLQSAKQTVPHFYLSLDILMDQLLELRSRFNARSDLGNLSVNDFVVRASAIALKQVPDVNVQFGDDKLVYFKRADISIAVAVDNGLVTPVIRDADNKGLEEIAQESRALADGAREGNLPPDALQGGTFTISNLGMYGIDQFDAIINEPQAAILAVGQCAARAVVRDGDIVAANVMTVTLSCDHRAIDGATGAKFLDAFKDLLENPIELVI